MLGLSAAGLSESMYSIKISPWKHVESVIVTEEQTKFKQFNWTHEHLYILDIDSTAYYERKYNRYGDIWSYYYERPVSTRQWLAPNKLIIRTEFFVS